MIQEVSESELTKVIDFVEYVMGRKENMPSIEMKTITDIGLNFGSKEKNWPNVIH